MSPLVNAASRLMRHYAKAEADVFIMTVPTPIDSCKRLDLSPLENASATVGRALKAPVDLSSSKGRPLPHRFRTTRWRRAAQVRNRSGVHPRG